MAGGLPAISGPDLIKLLKKDGWIAGRRANHGVALTKVIDEKTVPTWVPTKSRSLPDGTLGAILRQTGLGREGLERLLKK